MTIARTSSVYGAFTKIEIVQTELSLNIILILEQEPQTGVQYDTSFLHLSLYGRRRSLEPPGSGAEQRQGEVASVSRTELRGTGRRQPARSLWPGYKPPLEDRRRVRTLVAHHLGWTDFPDGIQSVEQATRHPVHRSAHGQGPLAARCCA